MSVAVLISSMTQSHSKKLQISLSHISSFCCSSCWETHVNRQRSPAFAKRDQTTLIWNEDKLWNQNYWNHKKQMTLFPRTAWPFKLPPFVQSPPCTKAVVLMSCFLVLRSHWSGMIVNSTWMTSQEQLLAGKIIVKIASLWRLLVKMEA